MRNNGSPWPWPFYPWSLFVFLAVAVVGRSYFLCRSFHQLNGDSITTRSARIGPALIGQRLWQACSIDKVLTALLRERHFEFSVERAIFLSVLHRLFAPGSDRAAEKWKHDYAIDGTGQLNLHHLYRAMAWLGEVLPKDQQNAATPFVPRTNKDLIEEELDLRMPAPHPTVQ